MTHRPINWNVIYLFIGFYFKYITYIERKKWYWNVLMVCKRLGVEVSARRVINLCFIYVSWTSVLGWTSCWKVTRALSGSSDTWSTSAPCLRVSLRAFLFVIPLLMISARKQKRLISSPTIHNPRGRWKCSIRRGSGPGSLGVWSKPTSVTVNPAWNVKI